MVICPTCDEPFVPEYAARCEGCGQAFPDGYEPSSAPAPAEPLNTRILVTLAALAILVVGMVIYLLSLFHGNR
jgi:hypothetical protein